MIDPRYNPALLAAETFQEAWARVVLKLTTCHGNACRNLMVQIADPLALKPELHSMYRLYTQAMGVNREEKVARGIFPDDLAASSPASLGSNSLPVEALTEAYHAPDGYMEQARRAKPRQIARWGSYFARMTEHGGVNQLANLIHAMRSRHFVMKGAYTMYTGFPKELTLNRGAPCLQYLAWQLEPDAVGLLAVYRNHSFTEMAYPNYHALGQLMEYVRDQTEWDSLGPLTVLSSHAYLDKQPGKTRNLATAFWSALCSERE